METAGSRISYHRPFRTHSLGSLAVKDKEGLQKPGITGIRKSYLHEGGAPSTGIFWYLLIRKYGWFDKERQKKKLEDRVNMKV